jgi:DNA-binding SARP family transcriptional activator
MRCPPRVTGEHVRERGADGAGTASGPRLHVLGDLEVIDAGEPLRVSLAAQRVLALVAVVHRERPASRTTLAEQLWLDLSAERAVSNLRSTLWRMPRPRGRALVTCTPRTVRLAPELAVDLWDADEQIRSPGGALDPALLRHDLLPRWDEEWLSVEREAFRQRRLHALESSSRTLREGGHYAEALTAALSAVRAEPLRETAHLRVIQVHLDEGNQSEAVRQYHHYRELLAAELGLGPSPALSEVMAPLLRRSQVRPRLAG